MDKRKFTMSISIILSLTFITFSVKAENLKPKVTQEAKIKSWPSAENEVTRGNFIWIPSHKEKTKLEFKLSGGVNYLSVGDWNTYMELDTKLNRDWADLFNNEMSGEFKKIHLGGEFEGEVIIYLTRRIGISVGTGYIWGKKGEDSSRIFIRSRIGTEDQSHDTKISAIPIKLGIYYSLPVFSRVNIYFNSGIGYYFARWSDNYYRETGPGWWEVIEQETSAGGFGLHGGVGLDYYLNRNFSFILEISGRYAKIGDFKGDYDYKNSGGFIDFYTGTLHYYEIDYTFIGLDWYPVVKILKEKPDSPVYRNIREATVDYSSIAVRIGIKLRF